MSEAEATTLLGGAQTKSSLTGGGVAGVMCGGGAFLFFEYNLYVFVLRKPGHQGMACRLASKVLCAPQGLNWIVFE